MIKREFKRKLAHSRGCKLTGEVLTVLIFFWNRLKCEFRVRYYSPHYCQWKRPKVPITSGLKAVFSGDFVKQIEAALVLFRLLSDASVFITRLLLSDAAYYSVRTSRWDQWNAGGDSQRPMRLQQGEDASLWEWWLLLAGFTLTTRQISQSVCQSINCLIHCVKKI